MHATSARRAVAGLALLVAIGAAAAPADAQLAGRMFTHGSTYVPGDTTGAVPLLLLQPAGTDLLFTNLDALLSHSVTSDAFKPGSFYERLFDSGPVNFRQEAPVTGVADLPAGTYGFFCTLHGGMRGAIDVVG